MSAPVVPTSRLLTAGDEYTPDEVEFLRAMEAFKKDHKRPFPTFVDVLRVAESIGYRRTKPEAA